MLGVAVLGVGATGRQGGCAGGGRAVRSPCWGRPCWRAAGRGGAGSRERPWGAAGPRAKAAPGPAGARRRRPARHLPPGALQVVLAHRDQLGPPALHAAAEPRRGGQRLTPGRRAPRCPRVPPGAPRCPGPREGRTWPLSPRARAARPGRHGRSLPGQGPRSFVPRGPPRAEPGPDPAGPASAPPSSSPALTRARDTPPAPGLRRSSRFDRFVCFGVRRPAPPLSRGAAPPPPGSARR